MPEELHIPDETPGKLTENRDSMLSAKMFDEIIYKKCKPGEIIHIDIKMINTG